MNINIEAKSKKHVKPTFNELIGIYVNDKSNKNFTLVYEEIRRIGMVAKVGLTVDVDDYESIATDIAMVIYSKIDTIYVENKSVFAYVFKSFKNKFYSLLKKYNKYVRESDMIYAGDDADISTFERVIYERVGKIDNIDEIFPYLHTSKELQFEEFYTVIDDLYPQEKEFVRELFEMRREEEVGNASLFVSPETVGLKYGIKNRTTISAKRTRMIQKISAELAKRVEFSKFADGENLSGTFVSGNKSITVQDNQIIASETVEKNGNRILKERTEEGWKFTRFDVKGTKIMEGVRDNEGNKIGFWSFFDENGKIEGRANHDHPQVTFCEFNPQGFGTEIGKLR